MKFWPVALMLAVATPAAAQVPNPSEAQTAQARSRGPCGDPWVTIALETAWGRADRWLCNIKLYNNGSWSSYNQLLNAVRATGLGRYTFQPVTLSGSGPLAGRQALGIFQGSTLVAAGGGNLVAAGGGNMVAAGGGNIINQVGNQLVTTGGGNFSLQSVGTPVRVMGQ